METIKGSLRALGQPKLHSEIFSRKKKAFVLNVMNFFLLLLAKTEE